MILDSDLVMHMAGIVAACAATWGAIRTDIRHMHERINEAARDIARAHERIDHLTDERNK